MMARPRHNFDTLDEKNGLFYNGTLLDEMDHGIYTQSKNRHKGNTAAAYKCDVKKWTDWHRDHFGHDPDIYSIKYPGDKIIYFAYHCATTDGHNMDHPVCKETIIRNCFGIRDHAISQGVPEDEIPKMNRSNLRLWALLNSIESRRKSKLAIRSRVLSQMIAQIDGNTLDGAIQIAVLCCAHNSIRRGSEATQHENGGLRPISFKWSNKTHFPTDPCLGGDEWVSYNFNSSKTNKDGKPQSALYWHRCKNDRKNGYKYPCAMCALTHLFNIRTHCGLQTPLTKMSNGKLFNMNNFLELVQRLYAKCTANSKYDVGTHSLRRGGYQDARAEGQHIDLVLAQAYWSDIRGAKPYEETVRDHDAVTQSKLALLAPHT